MRRSNSGRCSFPRQVKCDRPREFISDAGLLYIRGLVGAIRVTARVHVDLPPEMRATMFLELTAHLFQAAVPNRRRAGGSREPRTLDFWEC